MDKDMTRGEEYQEIRQTYERFIKAWETNQTELFDQCLAADAFTYFSIFGEGNLGRETLKRKLGERTHAVTFARFDTVNYACLMEGGTAQQSAYLNGFFPMTRKGRMSIMLSAAPSVTGGRRGWKDGGSQKCGLT